MLGTNYSRHAAWGDTLDEHRAVIERMLVNLDQEQREVDRLFVDLPADADSDAHPAFAAHIDVESFLAEAHDIALTAAYHWVERDLKALCMYTASVRGETKADIDGIRKFNFPELKGRFNRYRIALKNLPRHDVVEVMWRFANSWKHNAWEVDEELAKALKLTHPVLKMGHLGVDSVRRAFAIHLRSGEEVVAVNQDDLLSTRDVVRLCLQAADEFLHGVLGAAPDWP